MWRPAQPLARYGAMWRARFASGSATTQLHHALGHDLGLTAPLKSMTARIVSAYLEGNTVSVDDLPALIREIYRSLSGEPILERSSAVAAVTRAQIRKSITADGLVSFEDGRPYKTMKRHLARYGLTPPEYLAKWGLPTEYPMVAPNYAASRSAMAKAIGLGRKAAPPPTPPKARKSRTPKQAKPGSEALRR
jgi:predicted transcriptional regulator